MISRQLLRSKACLVPFLALTVVALAHEQKTALTDIFYNERTQHLEIAHRISLHDAEHALHQAAGLKSDLISSAQARDAFAQYTAVRFALISEDRTPIPLTLVGHEVEGGYLWIYQETPFPDPVATPYIVVNTILQDAVNGQVNTVNLRHRSNIATLVFEAGTRRRYFRGWQEL